jgi:hypothetical protein
MGSMTLLFIPPALCQARPLLNWTQGWPDPGFSVHPLWVPIMPGSPHQGFHAPQGCCCILS